MPSGMLELYRYSFILLCFVFSLFAKLNAQTTTINMDFESVPAASITNSSQIPGWNISHGNWIGPINTCFQTNCCNLAPNGSELIVAPPNGYIDPIIGPIYPVFSVFGDTVVNNIATAYNNHLNFPLTGNRFLRLNKSNSALGGNQIESLTRTFSITSSMNVIEVAYMILTNGAHLCCESPGFRMTISTSSCPIVFNSTCPSNSNTANSFYIVGTNSLSTNPNSVVYSKWQVKRYDLNNFIGQTVTLTINASGCLYNGHFGYAYVDAQTSASMFEVYHKLISGGTVTVPYCTTSVAIKAPPRYNTYQWLGPSGFTSTQTIITATASGVYTLNLDAASPCDAATKTIAVNFLPQPIILSYTSSICPGANLMLTASGAASYTWTHNSATTPTVLVNPVQTSAFSVLCLDTNNCLSTAFYTVTIKPSPNISITSLPIVCVGDLLKLNAQGANTYTWIGSNGQNAISNQLIYNTSILPELLSFTLHGTAANTCTASLIVTVQTQPLPIASISVAPSTTICLKTAISFKGTGGVKYLWFGPSNFFGTGETIDLNSVTLAQAGTYSLFVNDSNGCVGTASKPVVIQHLPEGSLSGVFNACTPFSSKFEFTEETTNKSKIVSVEWTVISRVFNQRTFTYEFNMPGNYTIQGKLIDSNSCVNDKIYNVVAYPKPKAEFTFSPEHPVANFEEVELSDRSVGDGILEWDWFIYKNKTHSEHGQQASFLFENEGLYPVALTIKNKWACADSIIKTIKVIPDIGIYVPNSFTPGGDNKNEIFIPVTRGISTLSMQIFNRWGQLIFESKDLNTGWDGSYKGQACKDDIYVWKLFATDNTLQTHERNGYVNLMR